MPSGSDTTEEAVSDTSPDGAVPLPGRVPPPSPRAPGGHGACSPCSAGRLAHRPCGVFGIALGLAFPPYDLWPLSVVAVAAVAADPWPHRPPGRLDRLRFRAAVLLILLKWLHVVGWDAVVGLSVAEALFLTLLGAALAVTSRLPGGPLWAACLWVAEEWARDRLPFGGFPWGRLAFANTGSPFTRSPRSAVPRW
ncbi:hypothetical protein O1L68_37020 [Streptomyces lydicus]|nr:hypothetical protein [Streptomyces lydicus]